MPNRFVVDTIGVGAGTADFEGHANVLRALVGHSTTERLPVTSLSELPIPANSDWQSDVLHTIETNLDDVTAEVLADASAELLGLGALDVWTAPITMKKGRSACQLSVLCQISDTTLLLESIFALLPTLGVRIIPSQRIALQREVISIETKYGRIKVKVWFAQRPVCAV